MKSKKKETKKQKVARYRKIYLRAADKIEQGIEEFSCSAVYNLEHGYDKPNRHLLIDAGNGDAPITDLYINTMKARQEVEAGEGLDCFLIPYDIMTACGANWRNGRKTFRSLLLRMMAASVEDFI